MRVSILGEDSRQRRPQANIPSTMVELNEITQHLLRFAPDALIVLDANARILFANDTVTQMFGHTPAALLGQPIDILVPERLRGRHSAHTAAFMQRPDNREMGARITDLFARRADGSEFSAGIRLAPFRIGERLYVAAAIRDTTERRQITDALVTAREEADRANRAKSRFLATASHDLRQPLQTIRLLNASLLKVVPQADVQPLLIQQQQAIEGMTRLLNALLDISRLESGAIEPVRADVQLSDLRTELHAEFDALAWARGLTLYIEPQPLAISTDPALFYQLLQNLVANALKYTDHGSITIRCVQDADALTITIEDTGIGIPADKLDRIFDEYYQVDTHGAKRMGVGLGLAIVKEVAKLLGLSVRITSNVGRGTQARIRVPHEMVVPARSSADAGGEVAPVAAAAEKPRLLLVEDNNGVRLATELFLKLEGYETRSAANAAEAAALFKEIRPGDIVIADYHLDGRNTGLEVLLRLRTQLGLDVPGIILSGDLPSVRRSLQSPVVNCRFLSKPVDTTALLDALVELGSQDQNSGAASS